MLLLCEVLHQDKFNVSVQITNKLFLVVQVAQSSKQAGSGKWSSGFRSLLVHGAHLAHLDSLLSSTSQSVTLVPQPADMAPFLGISSASSNQVSTLTHR